MTKSSCIVASEKRTLIVGKVESGADDGLEIEPFAAA
jgi:hypothetical protein